VSNLEPPTSPLGEPWESERLRHAKDAYQEVLDATKHQDDKIGRFLTGIAFLIAGALVFTSPEVLQARYAVGATHLRLPAIALITFMVLVVLSVLLYVLAMGAPLTIPSPPAARRSRGRSHLFFLLIAGETRESWERLWDDTASGGELERELLREYLSETRNIAQRVDQKYERSTEASALFAVALLFFLLGTVLSVDVLQHAKVPAGAALQVPADLDWSAPLRATVAIILALFAAALVYHRLRATQARGLDEIVRTATEGRRLPWRRELHLLLLAYPTFVLATLVPGAEHGPLREVGAGLAALAAVAGGIGYVLVLRQPPVDGGTTAARLARKAGVSVSMLVGVALAAAAWLAVHRGWPVWQLGLALGVAVSPLAANVRAASRKLHERVQWHLSPAEPALSALAPDGPGQPGGDGGPA
jgi:hypothetical protein